MITRSKSFLDISSVDNDQTNIGIDRSALLSPSTLFKKIMIDRS